MIGKKVREHMRGQIGMTEKQVINSGYSPLTTKNDVSKEPEVYSISRSNVGITSGNYYKMVEVESVRNESLNHPVAKPE